MSKPKHYAPALQPAVKPKNVKGKKVASRRSAEAQPLAEPVYHSTVALGHQLKNLQRMEFDAEGGVLKALEESDTCMARVNFAEKVAEAVNVSKKQTKYSGLISVDVPVEATIAQEVEGRMSRLKTSHNQAWRKPSKASEVPPPNIKNMFTPNLIVEEPIMDVPTLASLDVRPEPCSPKVAFELYKHMMCWDS